MIKKFKSIICRFKGHNTYTDVVLYNPYDFDYYAVRKYKCHRCDELIHAEPVDEMEYKLRQDMQNSIRDRVYNMLEDSCNDSLINKDRRMRVYSEKEEV